jgi:hypothetical protein
MKAHSILHHFSDETAGEVFQYLYDRDKPAYRACLQLLASRRRLRPVILERKPRAERHAWMRTELSRKANEDATTEILQTWMLGAHQAMVCQFLDSLGVPHNGSGLLDSLPADPGSDRLRAAIDQILQNHPPQAAAAYLHLFAEMDIADWPSLREILNQDSRLCLAPQTPAAI